RRVGGGTPGRDIRCPEARSGCSLLRDGLLLSPSVPRAQPPSLRPERELFPECGEPIEHLVVAADLAGGDVGGDVSPHHGAVPDRDAIINPRPLPDHHIITGPHVSTDLGAADDAAAAADGAALTDRGARADRRTLADRRPAPHGPADPAATASTAPSAAAAHAHR